MRTDTELKIQISLLSYKNALGKAKLFRNLDGIRYVHVEAGTNPIVVEEGGFHARFLKKGDYLQIGYSDDRIVSLHVGFPRLGKTNSESLQQVQLGRFRKIDLV